MQDPGSAGSGVTAPYFIQAHLPLGRAVFVFGVALRPCYQPDEVRSYTYSVDDPLGSEKTVDTRTTWPISEEFFEKARRVKWDMSDPEAPIEELEEAMRRFRHFVRRSNASNS